MNTTVAALKNEFQYQKSKGYNGHEESYVFGSFSRFLVDQAKKRKPIQDKKNYVEKIDSDSAHIQALANIEKIENYFFHKGVKNVTHRTLFSSLRDRMLFLFTTKGVLRGDTAFKPELSDLFHVKVKRHDDPHPLMVFILQFATGKTNHGVKLYGRVAWHVNVSLCPIGSIAFYLFYRFEVTKEMDEPNIDFFDNSTWFDIKFITDI